MQLQDKSIAILELPTVLKMLADEAISENAKEASLTLPLLKDIHIVRQILSETTAAKNMMTVKSTPPFSGVKEVRGSVQRADMGGMLNTVELLTIASLLRAAAAAVEYFRDDKEQDKTVLDDYFSAIKGNKFLEGKITGAIVAEDELSDNASSELSDIRRHKRQAADKVRQVLNNIITSQTYAKVLQEPIITLKNNRYVVPVKAEHKTALQGMVHDVSSSGATLFIEPMSVVNINNELRELEAKETAEIERILMELSADVAAHGSDIISDYEVLVKLDLIFAKAKLSFKMNAAEPRLTEEPSVTLDKARHPLLDPNDAVAIDIAIGGGYDTLVITGPNTGGKTVSLKTLGLLCAMTQCGLHIPATELSVVPVFDCILADIGDEQSIEQSLSTFSSHMTNIVEILNDYSGMSLLLFDELGAGTDPVEGAALAIAIIEHSRKNPTTLIAATTHYAELKAYALTTDGVMNASCEFDVETLRPTFRLLTGIPGKSNAFAISRRLGLPEAIIDDASSRISDEDAALEDAVMNLETVRVELESERAEAEKLRRDAELASKSAEENMLKIQNERANVTQKAKQEAEQIIHEARGTVESIMAELREIKRLAASDADWQRVNHEKAEILRKLNAAEEAVSLVADEEDTTPSRQIVPGDRVKLKSLGTTAEVISVGTDGQLSLQAGIMKITAKEKEVILLDSQEKVEIKTVVEKGEKTLREVSAQNEINLLGMTTDEAIPALERFLDGAKMAKLNTVTIIHGKGTGTLRNAVQQCLRKEKGIKSFRLGLFGEGEDGVTIAEFK